MNKEEIMSWQNNSNGDGPPDLDKMIINFLNKLRGKKTFNGFNSNGTGNGSNSFSFSGLKYIFLILAFLYIVSGFYIIQPAENAVITRLGKYTNTLGAGFHWMPRFIDDKIVVNVEQISSVERSSYMLTEDGNILHVTLTVQYIVNDAKDYLFNVVDPDMSLEQIADSALRDVVGHTSMDQVLTTGRAEVVLSTRALINEMIAAYNLGIRVSDVVLETVEPPTQVKEAFNDAIKAKSDEQAFINKAQEYTNKVLPEAKGRAARLRQEANAYKEKKVLFAKGDVAKFEQLLPEYDNAPEITRKRMYLQTMQDIMGRVSKVLVDVDGGNNMLYLPIDKIMNRKN